MGDYMTNCISNYNFNHVSIKIENIKNLSCGSSHCIFQNNLNELFVCGDNTNLQCFVKSKNIINEPIKLENTKAMDTEFIYAADSFTILYSNKTNDIFAAGYT